jgi:hypothetical protein
MSLGIHDLIDQEARIQWGHSGVAGDEYTGTCPCCAAECLVWQTQEFEYRATYTGNNVSPPGVFESIECLVCGLQIVDTCSDESADRIKRHAKFLLRAMATTLPPYRRSKSPTDLVRVMVQINAGESV